MKILVVVPDTNVGGVTSSAVNFCNELTLRKNNVYFLDLSGEYKCDDRLRKSITRLVLEGKSKLWNLGLECVKGATGIKKLGLLLLGAFKKVTIRSGLWYDLIFSRFKKQEFFDVAIAFRQCAPCYSFVLKKVNAPKKIGFVHGELKYMGDVSSWKRYMESFDRIAYVSDAVKKEFVNAYPELKKNACTIYNMFDVDQISRMAMETPAVVFDRSKVNIVTVSRIDNGFKQTHWIVEICRRLKEQTTIPFHWYVLGDGPDFKSTVQLAKDCAVDDVLTFAGNQPNPYAIMKQCDFTVLTSRSESFGMVVIESFVLKKPVVVARYDALCEIMEGGKHGLIAEQNIDSLLQCVRHMLENKDGIKDRCTLFLKDVKINNDRAYQQFCNALRSVN
ncbi:MAG: glycosyltransferase [Clostridia bacterium]|nr:glycosyltransferase [Clostridia bacterium]